MGKVAIQPSFENNWQIIRQASFDLRAVIEEHKFLLQLHGKSYFIGSYLYCILKGIKENQQPQELLEDLNQQLGNDYFTEEGLSEIIDQQIMPLLNQSAEPKKQAVKNLFQIVHPQKIEGLLKKLSFLFDERYFFISFFGFSLLSLSYLTGIRSGLFVLPKSSYVGMGANVIYFASIIFLLILHEIGHATASTAMGVKPGKIGFGIYFIFPAFYTDLSNAWGVSRKKRIIINLGGIYFQLILNALFLALLVLNLKNTDVVTFLRRCISFNIGISLYNLNPFFRFDGYWIYSDWFDVPNLRQQSNELTYNWIKRIKRFLFSQLNQIITPVKPKIALSIYTIGYLTFMGFVWYLLIRFALFAHVAFYQSWAVIDQFNVRSLGDWTSILFGTGMVISVWFILYFRIKATLKKVYHEI